MNAVVSMAASVAGNMWWSIALHNFSCYWGGGLAADDTSVIEAGLKGKVDEARFMQYAKYVQLLFKYADKKFCKTAVMMNKLLPLHRAKPHSFIRETGLIPT